MNWREAMGKDRPAPLRTMAPAPRGTLVVCPRYFSVYCGWCGAPSSGRGIGAAVNLTCPTRRRRREVGEVQGWRLRETAMAAVVRESGANGGCCNVLPPGDDAPVGWSWWREPRTSSRVPLRGGSR
ncbi:hypothetical protein GCM10023238_17180 [Streptomyces heliomycini]